MSGTRGSTSGPPDSAIDPLRVRQANARPVSDGVVVYWMIAARRTGWNFGLERAAEWSVTVEESGKAGTVDISRRLTARRGDVTVRLVVDEYRSLDPPR